MKRSYKNHDIVFFQLCIQCLNHSTLPSRSGHRRDLTVAVSFKIVRDTVKSWQQMCNENLEISCLILAWYSYHTGRISKSSIQWANPTSTWIASHGVGWGSASAGNWTWQNSRTCMFKRGRKLFVQAMKDRVFCYDSPCAQKQRPAECKKHRNIHAHALVHSSIRDTNVPCPSQLSFSPSLATVRQGRQTFLPNTRQKTSL